ncbi:MAG: Oxidoreductase [Verrucomicrobia bacterium]|nr:Oxidoreductase [Verrucomicrobiota bacterium]
MNSPLKLGIIGLDTSHVLVFSDTFNNPASKQALKGARITVAWPGGSPDIQSSISRVPGYTTELREKFGVEIVDSPEAVAQACDAILLTSLDGRTHPGQFARIAPFGKPVFMDKPFAVSTADAKAIFATAKKHNVRLFSSSSLRFTEALVKVVTPENRATVRGADFCGAAAHEPTNPGLYWYGIHAVEMLFTTMGRGCRSVRCVSTENSDLATGVWADGRIGTVRGSRTGNYEMHGLVHFEKTTVAVNVQTQAKPFYASLTEAFLAFFQGGPTPIDPEETIELIRFIEAANESAANNGREVLL